MAGVRDALIHAYAFFAVIPPFPFVLVYGAVRLGTRDPKRAFRAAMDVTTAFLIGSVAVLINQLSGSRFGLYLILLVMLVGAGLLGGAQNRMRGKVDGHRLVRTIWRLSFFVLGVLYIILMIAYLVAFLASGA